jgi:O-antigen chain-terminating methyltransferase
MFRRTVSESDLARLKREREEADRRYNQALTELDRSLWTPPDFPHAPPPPDEHQVTPLNERWRVTSAILPAPGGWRGRLAGFVWRLVRPVVEHQEAFNAAVVDHVNRNLAVGREVSRAAATVVSVLRDQVERLVAFHTRLILYLQQVTPYVDRKDYEFAGLSRREIEDTKVELERLDGVLKGLAASLSGVGDEMLRRWESLLARDRRYDARIGELATAVSAARHQATALARELARGASTGDEGEARSAAAAIGAAAIQGAPVGSSALESWKYVGFEDQFRGTPDTIRARLEPYAPLFDGASDVLDVGCGRGEFLELLRLRGIRGRGIDVNHEMVELCRSRGLDVEEADALGYLTRLSDGALGGVFAAQVVEHLAPDYLLALLEQAARVLRPGSRMVLETINVASWTAFFESYLRDPTHARPLYPDTLRYLVIASGFEDVSVRFSAPVPPADRLQPAPRIVRTVPGDAHAALVALADVLDGNAERLNRLLFADMDYAIVARRP